MGTINGNNINTALSSELFVKSPKGAKKVIRLESSDTTAENIIKLNKKMYQRKVQGY